MENKDTLYIGLCLAGAVSAGAYTAGVIDYFLEALEEWESKRGQNNVPTHKVVVPAIGGASAGGMTGIIMASAINNPITPVKALPNDIFKEQPQNKFYHSWVDLLASDMFPFLLKNDDINGKVYSLFNSRFIDDISHRAIKVDKSNFVQRPYFDKHLKVFTTLTNLKGFSYNVDLSGGHAKSTYYLSRHNDFAAFVLNKAENEYKKDGWIPLDLFTDTNVEIARNAAMATGAFPIGLRSRNVVRKMEYLNDLLWHQDITRNWPLTVDPDSTLCVDGGMIDNEPFFRVKDLLSKILKEKSENLDDYEASEDPDSFESTMIMVDPFPSKVEEFKENDGLTDVIGSTLSAMIAQMRIKPEALRKIYDKNNQSQYLIAPSRKINGSNIEGEHAIACGFFGGFGGFINKEFRIHDYFLGRGNFERFIREHFTIPENNKNPIFTNGYKGIDPHLFKSKDGRRQIIPLFTPEEEKMYMPQFNHHESWPIRRVEEIDIYKKDIRERVGKIIMNLTDYSWKEKLLIGIGNKVVLKKSIANAFLNTIKKSMVEWKLLQ
ncbi:hypothetical protein BH23BAC1_BH23BAC1_43750 [soil metagenome]